MKVVVVTGVSGAGKSTALRALEDLGFYCADNLPMPLLPKFIELLADREEVARAALVVDARSGDFLDDSGPIMAAVRAAGHSIEVLFLDAPDEVLIRRFSETRRRHPLSGNNVREGLHAERASLSPLRQEATTVIDTRDLTVHGLRALVLERYGRSEATLAVTVLSFGFKYGLPTEADIVLDVRFLPNPFFVEGLSTLSGEDAPVQSFVLENPESQLFLGKAEELLALCLAAFEREGKSYATVAIGCTGGRHRSVVLALELGRRLKNISTVSVRHRDVHRSLPGPSV
ncbi:MAG TPA: RNase adapter RapZ [Polyangia bacterium]